MKKFCIVILVTAVFSGSFCIAYETTMTREGCYIDLRGQIHSPYDPPNPENIPQKPNIAQPITSYEQYYDVNCRGYRRPKGKVPIIPGYSAHYSTRIPHPYTKEQFIRVWQNGKKSGKIDCLTDKYAISYFFIDNWATGIIIAKWRARKVPQKAAAFFFIEDLATEDSMYKAKQMAELLGVEIFFGTIDKQIPAEWVR